MRYDDRDIFDLIVVPHEGGAYTNDLDDPGGPTRWGVTLEELSAWLGQPCSADDVQALSRERAEAFYIERYFARYVSLFDPLRLNVIDMAINAGHARGVRLLQQAVGAKVDGAFGPETIRLASRDYELWNEAYSGIRLGFYAGLVEQRPRSQKFLTSWRRRALSFLRIQPDPKRAKAGREGVALFGPSGKAYVEAA